MRGFAGRVFVYPKSRMPEGSGHVKAGVYPAADLELHPTLRLWHSLASIFEAHQLALSALLARDRLPRDAEEYLGARVYGAAVEARRARERVRTIEAEAARGGVA